MAHAGAVGWTGPGQRYRTLRDSLGWTGPGAQQHVSLHGQKGHAVRSHHVALPGNLIIEGPVSCLEKLSRFRFADSNIVFRSNALASCY